MTSYRLTLCLSALMALAAGCGRGPYASPTALRNTNTYAKAVQAAAPERPDERAFDGISISYETNQLTVIFPAPVASGDTDGLAHTVKRLNPGEALKGDEAVLEFLALGVATLTNLAKPDGQVPLALFSPDCRPLSEGDLTSLGFKKWERTVYASTAMEKFPSAVFVFGSKAHPPGYYKMRGLFDARTHRPFTTGSSYSQVSSDYLGRLSVQYEAWHQTPLELVLDVELDGSVAVVTNPVADSVIPVPGGLVKIVGVWGGRINGSSSYGGTPSRVVVTLSESESRGGSNSFLVFACEPPGLAVHPECLDGSGAVINHSGAFGAGAIHSLGLKANKNDVKQVRLTVFTNHYSVILPVPPLPGLPPQNRQIRNLFNVRIPGVRLEREDDLRRLISSATETDFAYPPFGDIMPKGSFPMLRTNTTPAELLAEYSRHIPWGYRLAVDQQKQELRAQQTDLAKAVTWARQHLQRLFR
jgi:hypothetical protein